jgi:hypothetical protein
MYFIEVDNLVLKFERRPIFNAWHEYDFCETIEKIFVFIHTHGWMIVIFSCINSMFIPIIPN